MSRLGRKLTFLAAIVAVGVMGLALPGEAGYTKLYRFKNTSGTPQTSVRALLSGLESIAAHKVGCCSMYKGWVPGSPGYLVVSGVYCTKLTYAGGKLHGGNVAQVGWRTADGSCRLRDLRWGNGQVIVPKQIQGVPGGGIMFYDYPNPGDLTVVITNDNPEPDQVILLADVEFGLSGYELSLDELSHLLDVGLAELRVAGIDDDIAVLRAEVVYQGSVGGLPSPSANSIVRKMDRAAAYMHDGLAEYLAGDLDGALFLWEKAAQHVTNLISEVTAADQKGNLAPGLYDRWIVDGGDEIATAPEIRDALLALPDGQPLQSLDPLPPGTPLPAYPGLDPEGHREWPVTELWPGEYTAFVVHHVGSGAGFIMGGSVLDEPGDSLLDWTEQSVAEPAVIDAVAPVISATATPACLWPPEHEMVEMALNVTVSDTSEATWYVAGVASNQPEDGTGDGDYAPDWILDPEDPQSVSLRAERSGNHPEAVRRYTITLIAIDAAGNISKPYDLIVPVEHDMG